MTARAAIPSGRDPLQFGLTVSVAARSTPTSRSAAAPIAVVVYELRINGASNADDFVTLMDKGKTAVADDLAKRDQFQLRPGEHATIGRSPDRSTTTQGILAAYRDPPNSEWRAVYALPITPGNAWYRFRPPRLNWCHGSA